MNVESKPMLKIQHHHLIPNDFFFAWEWVTLFFLEQNRRESETKIAKIIDERLYKIKLDLAKEKKNREESENKYYKQYGEQIGRLQEEIDLENKVREENMQRLVRNLSEEIGKFHEMLQLERKVSPPYLD